MFFGYSDRDDGNGDGYVDFNERAEADYAYDSIMGTNIFGFCPENDEIDCDYYDEGDEDFDDEYEDEDEYENEDFDEFDDCDEW